MIKNKNKTNSSKKDTTFFTEKPVEMTPCNSSQTVEVRGTKRMLVSKSKKATWY